MKKFVIQDTNSKYYLSHFGEVFEACLFKEVLSEAFTFNSWIEARKVIATYLKSGDCVAIPVEVPINSSQGFVQTQTNLVKSETVVVMCPECSETSVFTYEDYTECSNCHNTTDHIEDWDAKATRVKGEDENGKFVQLTVRL